jgi:DNA-binding response OmpR family regulator
MHIMVLDDDEVIGRSIRRMLKSDDVALETDPARALTTINNGHFDVVLCDLRMPGMLGTSLFDAVRAHHGANAPLLFLMTGALDVVAPNADGILPKPFHRSELLALLDASADHARRALAARRGA